MVAEAFDSARIDMESVGHHPRRISHKTKSAHICISVSPIYFMLCLSVFQFFGSVCLSACLPVYLKYVHSCLSGYHSVFGSVSPRFSVSICKPVCLSLSVFVCLSVILSRSIPIHSCMSGCYSVGVFSQAKVFCMPVWLSVCLSVCLSV